MHKDRLESNNSSILMLTVLEERYSSNTIDKRNVSYKINLDCIQYRINHLSPVSCLQIKQIAKEWHGIDDENLFANTISFL